MPDTFERLKAALGDRYAIERELGRGGMATVYLAEDLKHERKVAVKVLHPELAVAIGTDRFLREIRITAKLNHPHILPLHDSGEAADFLYFVMPYVEGESLRARMDREGRLEVPEAVRIARQVADALDYAHRHDVVHRDVKPENILLEEPHAVVADFGVARAVSAAGGEQLTQTGLAIGTPVYMSPEQAVGSAELDGRTDIYSLGCVLFEMLTGTPPFTGSTAQEIISKRFTASVPSAAAQRASTPPEVETALSKALAPALGDRFTAAADFARALGALGTAAAAPFRPSRRRSPVGSRWAVVSLALVAVAALGVVLVQVQSERARVSALEVELEPAISEHRFSDVAERLQAEGLSLNSRSLSSLAGRVGGTVSIASEPDRATLRLTRVDPIETFNDREPAWEGQTPIVGLKLVTGEYVAQLSQAGTNGLTFPVHVRRGGETRVSHLLVPRDSAGAGMVAVTSGRSPVQRVVGEVPSFLIDRHEVTNAEFLQFVNAGGYRDPSYWSDTLRIEGRAVPWDVGIQSFVDRTGLPGPRFWSGGRFESGKDDHPVVGVSWYDANAYANWAGKALPSWDHWWRAALGDSLSAFPWGNDVMTSEIRANFSLVDTSPVGSHPFDVSPFGVLDMGGNVREWLQDADSSGFRRLVVGGSWQQPTYMFEPAHAEPFTPDFANDAVGFRLVRFR